MLGYLHVCVCVHMTQMYFREVRNFSLPEKGTMSAHKEKSDLVRRADFRLQLSCFITQWPWLPAASVSVPVMYKGVDKAE